MSLLKEKRFNVIPVQQLIEMINAGGNIPPKTVALTFDDGYGSVCTRALPILRSHAFSACVFLATHYMGNNRSFPWLRPDPEEDARPLGWEEVERLRRENLEIGSHTALHKFLPALRNGELEKELLDSRDTIRQKMGAVPTFFALPFSFPLVHRHWPGFRERLLFALSKAGYECCCTLQRGRVSAGKGILFLPRVPVMRDDGPARFLAKALGLYSYTGFAQYLFQRFFKAYGEAQGR
jgi:peptidoglycan/xylan/chitin deacetylase (PgdA/CDA1 family)